MSVRVVEESKEESQPNLKGIKRELQKLQDEYFEIVLEIKKDGSPFNTEGNHLEQLKQYEYKLERLKILQRRIIKQLWWEQKESIRNAKMALEEAFTPRLKKMLSEHLTKNSDSIIFEGVRYVPEKSKEVNNDSNRDETNE